MMPRWVQACSLRFAIRIFCVIALQFFAVPASSQITVDTRWGVLHDMAERDFETSDGVLTVRWEVFNEALVLTDWMQSAERISRFYLDPMSGELTVESKFLGRMTLAAESGGDLAVSGGGQKFLWREDAGRFFRFDGSSQAQTIVPLGPTVSKVRRVAKLISTGKVKPVSPDFRQQSSNPLAVNMEARPAPYKLPSVQKPVEQPPAQKVSPVAASDFAKTALQVVVRTNVIEPRIALIIGNSRYGNNLGALPNPNNDARLIAGVLRSLGFDVELLIDGNQKAMKRAISNLGQRLEQAGRGSTGLFYFAGHGMQSRGQNFLIPIGAAIEREADLELEAVAADTVLSQMVDARATTNILILDACRNTPILRSFRSGERGLARMQAPNGSFISYSTAPGSVAYDGDGRYSPFADALSKELITSGQPIEATFRKVRKSVLTSTDGRQTPWDASSLTDTFLFKR